MRELSVAVVGATGAVGRTIVSILEERDFPVGSLRLMASPRSAGAEVETRWGAVKVEDLAVADPNGVDIALFSAGGERSRRFSGSFVEAGSVVIDNSSAFRLEAGVPLIVVGINDDAVHSHQGVIANPNCTTMTLMMATGPLHRAAGLVSAVATSYQAVSGSGQQGVSELIRQTDALRPDIDGMERGGWKDPGAGIYARPIGFNVLPLAGTVGQDGYTDEELKLVNESRKILDISDLAVEPTCVRVPVMTGHAVAASLHFERALSPAEALDILGDAPGVQVWVDQVPTPLDSAGLDDVLVGRVRPTLGESGGLNLWAVGDNLRKGAALNAVQIAELLL